VIVNEFGDVGIDHQLVIDADEEIFEMNNGCICCTVRRRPDSDHWQSDETARQV
jgi:G3E family GTPase